MMMGKRQGFFFGTLMAIIALLALAAPVAADDHVISPGVGAIQAAVTAASDGDTIILNPGTYPEHDIAITGKSLTFRADTANGHGPGDTIIDMKKSGRLFYVTAGSSLTIDNLSLQNGVSTNGMGGAIYVGSGGGSITVTSSTFFACESWISSGSSGGGAIYVSGSSGGSVTVTSSTFIWCMSRGFTSRGGAIYVAGGGGSVTVTSSTFSECSARDQSYGLIGTVGYGGAIYSDGGVTVTSSTFSRCSVGSLGQGSAIFAGSGTIHFSRIINCNTVTAVCGPIIASDNWWGSNAGPSSSHLGCGATAASWLVLGATAAPSTTTTAQTSVVRANLTFNSTGLDTSGSGRIADDIPVTFSSTGTGLVFPGNGYIGSGVSLTEFSSASAGTATITATVDGQTVTVPVTVTTPAAGTNVTSIVIDPATPANVYAGLDGSGIYRSTTGGTLWLPATTQPVNKNIRALVIRPAAPATLFAGTYGGGVYTSADSGDTWEACTNTNLGNLNVLSLVSNSTGGLYAGTENGVYASTDCNMWTAINGGLP
jgi:hypothetical protein